LETLFEYTQEAIAVLSLEEWMLTRWPPFATQYASALAHVETGERKRLAVSTALLASVGIVSSTANDALIVEYALDLEPCSIVISSVERLHDDAHRPLRALRHRRQTNTARTSKTVRVVWQG
jgi:hypothetical protein